MAQAQGLRAWAPEKTVGVDDKKSTVEEEPEARREKVIRFQEFDGTTSGGVAHKQLVASWRCFKGLEQPPVTLGAERTAEPSRTRDPTLARGLPGHPMNGPEPGLLWGPRLLHLPSSRTVDVTAGQ